MSLPDPSRCSLDLPRVGQCWKGIPGITPSYQLEQLRPCGVAGVILLDHDGLHDLSGATQMASSPSAFPFDPHCVQLCRWTSLCPCQCDRWPIWSCESELASRMLIVTRCSPFALVIKVLPAPFEVFEWSETFRFSSGWINLLYRITSSSDFWSIPFLFTGYGNIEFPTCVDPSVNPSHKVHNHAFCGLNVAIDTHGSLFWQSQISLKHGKIFPWDAVAFRFFFRLFFCKDGSAALSFYSSTLTVSCTYLPTFFPISFSSSSIPVFCFPESLRNVSVAFLKTSFALWMTLSLSHLFLSPASSGVVPWYLPEDQNSASQLTHKAKQDGFSARQHAHFLPGSLSNVGREGPSTMPALLQFVSLVLIDHIFG